MPESGGRVLRQRQVAIGKHTPIPRGELALKTIAALAQNNCSSRTKQLPRSHKTVQVQLVVSVQTWAVLVPALVVILVEVLVLRIVVVVLVLVVRIQVLVVILVEVLRIAVVLVVRIPVLVVTRVTVSVLYCYWEQQY